MSDNEIVRFADLRPSEAQLDEEIDAVRSVLERGIYVLGPEVDAFEAALCRANGVANAVAVGSGTDALSLGLRALGIGQGDEVIVPAFTAFPDVAAIVDAGAHPVLVDVRSDRPILDAEAASAAVTDRTRGVLLVHLYGSVDDTAIWVSSFEGLGIHVIEDCAQAQGARLPDGRPAGSVGRFGALSFYPTKNLGGTGDGGAVLTNDPILAKAVRTLRNHGLRTRRALHQSLARNSRLDEVQAAILRRRLLTLDSHLDIRRDICSRYREQLRGHVHFFDHGPGAAPHLAVIRIPDPDAVASDLRRAGIETVRHYPLSLPDQPALRRVGLGTEAPNASAWSASCLSLPLHARLDERSIERVVAAVITSVARNPAADVDA